MSKRPVLKSRRLARSSCQTTAVGLNFGNDYGRSRVFGRNCWLLNCRAELLVVCIKSLNQRVKSVIRLPWAAVISAQDLPRW